MVDKCPCLKSSCNGANWQCDSVGMDDGASGHCPECGSPLGFDADGTPTVGATYAEVARKAAAFDRLEAYLKASPDCLVIDGAASVGYDDGYELWHDSYSAPDLLALAESLPDPQ